MPCTANTLRCLVRDMRHQRGFAGKIGAGFVFQGHLHSPQPDPRMGFHFSSGNHTEGWRYVDIGSTAPWVCYPPSSAQHVLGTSPTSDSSTSCWFVNGGPVLRWRGPFFFLPTNPLHSGIVSLLGRLSTVFMGRNRQLLPTALASRSPRFIGYGESHFGCYPFDF